MSLLQSVRSTACQSTPTYRITGSQPTDSEFTNTQQELTDSFADRVKEAGDLLDTCLIGWDSLNEPDEGFIGIPDLNVIPPTQDFVKGPVATPLQSLILGYGNPVSDVQNYDFTSTGAKKLGKISLTPPEGKGVWMTRTEAKDAETRWGWKWGSEWDFWETDGSGGCVWAGHDV